MILAASLYMFALVELGPPPDWPLRSCAQIFPLTIAPPGPRPAAPIDSLAAFTPAPVARLRLASITPLGLNARIAGDWVPVAVNTPLLEGDEIWVPDGGRVRLTVKGRGPEQFEEFIANPVEGGD